MFANLGRMEKCDSFAKIKLKDS